MKLAVFVGIAATLFGLAGHASRAVANDKIDFRLDWSLSGFHLPFYWAEEKGYYRDEGLDVEIKQGAGSQQTINLLAGGHDDMGFADLSLMAGSVSKGMQVKAVFAAVQKDAWSIHSHSDKPIHTPQDLIGKSIVLVADHKPMIDLLLKLNNIDPSQVTMRIANPQTRSTLFAHKAADGVLSVSMSATQTLGGGDIQSMTLSNFGVNLLGQGIIAGTSYLNSHPDTIRRFIRATARAFKETSQPTNIEEALSIALELSGASPKQRDIVREQWQKTIPLLVSKTASDKPIGWMSDEDWRDTLSTLRATGRITTDVNLPQLYTDDFIAPEN